MRRSLLLMSALLLSPAALAEGKGDTQAARQVLDQVQAAFNAHDPAKLAQVFAPDATIMDPSGRRMHGRDAIQKQMAEQLKTQFKGATSRFILDGTRPIGSNAMWVDATHQITNMLKPDGTRGSMTFHLAALVVKQGNHWVAEEARPYAFVPRSSQGVGGAGPSGMK